MAGYFIRRYFLIVLLAPLLVYTVIINGPGGVIYKLHKYERGFNTGGAWCVGCKASYDVGYVDPDEARSFKLPQPWPLNYATFLFDPKETRVFYGYQFMPIGVDFNIGEWHIRGSGAVTGNLGRSRWVARSVPVGDVIGPGAAEVVGASVFALLLLIIVAGFQRLGRPAAHMLSRRVRYKPSDRLAGLPRAQLFV